MAHNKLLPDASCEAELEICPDVGWDALRCGAVMICVTIGDMDGAAMLGRRYT